MVGRIDNSTTTAPVASSAGKTVSDSKVQEVTPIQGVSVKIEQKPDNPERQMPAEQAQDMVESMNNFLMSADSQLKFVFHDQLNQYYVTIVDSKTDEVIREIPSKKLMDIHAAMRDFVGLLVDRKI